MENAEVEPSERFLIYAIMWVVSDLTHCYCYLYPCRQGSWMQTDYQFTEHEMVNLTQFGPCRVAKASLRCVIQASIHRFMADLFPIWLRSGPEGS